MSDNIFLLPGPTQPSKEILKEYSYFYGSSDLQINDFIKDYDETCLLFSELLNIPSSSSIVIMSGEGMLSLWSSLKSIILPEDKVFSINSGIYGKGIGEMAFNNKANVKYFNIPYSNVFNKEHWNEFEKQVEEFKPKIITLVHCETPTGTIVAHESLDFIGNICNKYNCIFYVDMVSSTGGIPINLSSNQIDLALIGSQKCFSLHSDLSIVIVSNKAWNIMEATNKSYSGYDALLPWKNVVKPLQDNKQERLFPYTMNWSSINALKISLQMLKDESFECVYKRHITASQYCIERILKMDLELYTDKSICSPTVTAIKVPNNISWKELQNELIKRKVFFGRNYGNLDGKVFRIGHMGTQADINLLEKALNILEDILKSF